MLKSPKFKLEVSIAQNSNTSLILAKGQTISKELFGILGFFQKNERTTSFLVLFGEKNEFVRSFFARIQGYQKSFRNHLTFMHKEKSLVVKVRGVSICDCYCTQFQLEFYDVYSSTAKKKLKRLQISTSSLFFKT
jgi:hypothetical protein